MDVMTRPITGCSAASQGKAVAFSMRMAWWGVSVLMGAAQCMRFSFQVVHGKGVGHTR